MSESARNEPFSLFNTAAVLKDDGAVSSLDFESVTGEGWIVAVQHIAASWPEWERHEDGDAFLFLLWGAAVVLTAADIDAEPVPHELKAASAFIIPAGTWYRVTVDEPANVLYATRASRTQGQQIS